MGAVMGTNAMRRSGALNFLGALGVKTPPGIATGKRTKEELAAAAAADAAAKTSVLGRMGTMVTAIKGQSAKITRLVDALPVPDSVKSFVHDPKSVLPKSARDLLDTAQNSFNQPGESADNADLENAEPPKESVILAATTGVSTPKSILKKESRVTIAPSPTFSDDVVLDAGIQLTNTRAHTPTQLRTPVRNTTNNTYDNLDNLDENVLIPDAATLSSNFVRNPGSLGTQASPTIIKPKIPTPTLPEGCKCEACLAAKAAHAPPPPPPSTADVMKQLEDLKKFMVEQMKPQQPVTVPVPEAEAAVVAAPVVAAPVPEAPVVAAPVPIPVPVSASEPAERLPKIVYPGNGRSHTSPITGKVEPVMEAPVTEAPVTEAPVTEAPVTEAPVTEALVTEATETKVSETPITEATETRAPITETQDPPKATIEVNAHELEEIRALLAERQKYHQVRS
jgi:hypothetical protein